MISPTKDGQSDTIPALQGPSVTTEGVCKISVGPSQEGVSFSGMGLGEAGLKQDFRAQCLQNKKVYSQGCEMWTYSEKHEQQEEK